MPRYRKLHLKAAESLDINEMPDDFHRLLWLMLPLGLDREGRGLDNTAWVHAKLMPLRQDVSHQMIDAALTWYAARGMIQRYEVGGRRFICVPPAKWTKYQGDTKREAVSEYPAPTDVAATYSRPTQDQVATSSGSYSYSKVDAEVDAGSAEPRTTTPQAAPERPERTPLSQFLDRYAVTVGNSPTQATQLALVDECAQGSELFLRALFEQAATGDDGKRRAVTLPLLKSIALRANRDGCLPGQWPGDRPPASSDPPPKPQPATVRIYNDRTEQIEEYDNTTGAMRVIERISDVDYAKRCREQDARAAGRAATTAG